MFGDYILYCWWNTEKESANWGGLMNKNIIIDAKLSKQIVNCGETFSISVSIISNDYLSLYKHSELKSYTHSQLKEGDGVIGR